MNFRRLVSKTVKQCTTYHSWSTGTDDSSCRPPFFPFLRLKPHHAGLKGVSSWAASWVAPPNHAPYRLTCYMYPLGCSSS